jgi:hypothetical protein
MRSRKTDGLRRSADGHRHGPGGAAARGKRIAFGDGKKILWDHHSELIFRGNPNVAPPGSEGSPDLEWIPFYRGNRLYNRQAGDRWIWNQVVQRHPGRDIPERGRGEYASHFGAALW